MSESMIEIDISLCISVNILRSRKVSERVSSESNIFTVKSSLFFSNKIKLNVSN